jgi:hypothetical protein
VFAIVSKAFGFELGREVRYPMRLMSVMGPLLAERELLLRGVNAALQQVWKMLVERYDLVPAIMPAVDKEGLSYASREMVFDNKKLRALGFEFKYKSIAEGYPGVLRWFQEHRWAPTYRGGPQEWGGGVGLQFAETMAGTWTPAGRSEARPFKFTITARAESARQFARDGLLEIDGTVTAGGLASGRPLKGTLDISWRKRRTLVYDFAFEGDDGRPYRFAGTKFVKVLRLLATMTTLPGRVLDASGAEVGTAMTFFDTRDLPALAASLQATSTVAQAAPARAQ